jgi:hypothetical protein
LSHFLILQLLFSRALNSPTHNVYVIYVEAVIVDFTIGILRRIHNSEQKGGQGQVCDIAILGVHPLYGQY